MCLHKSECFTPRFLVAFLFSFLSLGALAVDYNMSNGSFTLNCGTTNNFYDSGGAAGNYGASQNITTTFSSSIPGQCITVNFTSVNVESGWDYLTIYDGPNSGSPQLVELSGSYGALSYTSSSGSLTFVFTSDGSFNDLGWSASLSCTTNCSTGPPPCSNCTNPTVVDAIPFNGDYTTCGACNNIANGTICAEGLYLGGEDYVFSFTPTTTGPYNVILSNTSGYTGVFVTQGCPTAGGTCVGQNTNSAGNPSLTNLTLTAGVEYFIVVDTWPSPACTGFTIDIEETYIDPNAFIQVNGSAATCIGNYYDSGGSLSGYANNEYSVFTLCSDQSGQCIMVNFLSFQTEACCDQLNIYDGPNTSSTLIGSYAGTTIPPTIISTSGCLTFEFDSDGSVTSTGWQAAITCLDCGGGPCEDTCDGGPAPSNDACSGAMDLGTLPAPAACPNGSGTPVTIQTTNLCATGETPYSSLLDCTPLGDQANPAADVWYTFDVIGPVLQVLINGLQTPNVALYEGTSCINLVPRGCAIGANGVLNTSFQGLAAGTYYLQVSGESLVDQCDFSLTLNNSYDCAGCVIQSALTSDPPPVNGTYQAGTEVSFCYTITDYNQTSANWLHAVVPTFGAGWDLSTLSTTPATACTATGFWAWYNSNITSTATGQTYGPGFYFETAAGGGTGSDGNPGNNFGDNNGGNVCDWTFCWTISTLPEGSCVQGASLNIAINSLGDGESGSWTSLACNQDPVTSFFAQLNCCPNPIVNITNPICPGDSNGSASAQGQGTAPWTYVWKDSGGNTLQTNTSVNGSSTISGLAAGTYLIEVTDGTDCTSSALVVVEDPLPIAINVTPSAPIICEGGSTVLTASGATTYAWTPSTNLSSSTGTSVTASPTSTTTYTVQGFNGVCSGTTTVTVTVQSPSDAEISYAGSPYCVDYSGNILPTIVGTSGGVFTASPSGLSIVSSTGSITPSSSSPGTYTITYTLAATGSCPAYSTTTTVVITGLPIAPTLIPTDPCEEEPVTFIAGNGSYFEFFVNGVSQLGPSTSNNFSTSDLQEGDEVCVRSYPLPPFVMQGLINESAWGTPLATSAGGPSASGFGGNNRVDALYLKNYSGKLYGAIAGNENDGNDQMNNNWILMFIDSKPGGFNNLQAWTNRLNVPSNTSGILNLALYQNVVFDAGFQADYILAMNQAGATAYFDLYDMVADQNTYLGSNLSDPLNFGFTGNTATGDFTRGFEFSFPLSSIGSPATSLSVFVMMINDPNSGAQTYLSNQFLSHAGSGQGNFADGYIDFNNEPPSPIQVVLSADCFSETCVDVIERQEPTFNVVGPICYGETGVSLPTTSLEGITGTWSPAINNTTTTTYTFTPDPGQCAEDMEMTIDVIPPTTTTPIYHD